MNPDLEEDRKIAAQLHRAWPAFFEKFGRLTDVQRKVIPLILDGKNILICSATATGKTEAVCAPLFEKNIDCNSPWTILYICPTRALVNDLYERLLPPFSKFGLNLIRRTGDHRTEIDFIPHVLITTPESFDSILCRGKFNKHNKNKKYGHALARVVALVLDEIHLLYGSPRGEQVRWLIERLKRLKMYAKEQGWSKTDKMQENGLMTWQQT